MSRKKIAVVIPSYGPVGGGEHFAYELMERVAQNARYEVHVIASEWQAGTDKITFHRIPLYNFPRVLRTLLLALSAKFIISMIRPDLVHTHDRIFNADLWSIHSIPHKFWVREVRKKRFLGVYDLITCWVERCLYEKSGCRLFMPVSSLSKAYILKEYDVPEERIRLFSPGIDPDERRIGSENSESLSVRDEFGISSSDILVLFVAMNFELKGLDTILQAVASVRRQGKGNVSVLVVGRGDEEKYREVSRKLGLSEKVIFAGIRSDMFSIYKAGDLLALISDFDTFGMVVAEAMAASLPVVVSENVGAKDLVLQGENGFVITPGDVDGLSDCLMKLTAEKVRTEMGRKSQQCVQEYSWDRKAQELMEIYERLLAR